MSDVRSDEPQKQAVAAQAARQDLRQARPVLLIRGVGLILRTLQVAVVARVLQPEGLGTYTFVVALILLTALPSTVGLRKSLTRAMAYATAQFDHARAASHLRWALFRGVLLAWLTMGLLGVYALWSGANPQVAQALVVGVLTLLFLPVARIMAGALQGQGKVLASQLPNHVINPVTYLTLLSGGLLVIGAERMSVPVMLMLFASSIAMEALVAVLLYRFGRPCATEGPSRSAKPVVSDPSKGVFAFTAIAGVHVLNGNLDILMLTWLDGSMATGVYRASSAVAHLVVFGLGVMNATILHRVAHLYALGKLEEMQALITLSSRWVIAFAAAIALYFFIAGEFALRVMYGEVFVIGYPVLMVLVIGQVLNVAFGPVALILNMTGHERETLIGLVASVAVNLALNLALIPQYGMVGAACATAGAMVVWNAILFVALRRRVGITSTAFRF